MPEPAARAQSADEWHPVLAFDTDDDEFGRGFEAGRIDGILSQLTTSYVQAVSGRNAEMMARIAARHRRALTTEERPDAPGDWMIARFGPAGSA